MLDRAIDVFWRYGYEGTTITELSATMGLSAPSIYSAFGNKRGLFDAVLDRYTERQSERGAWILSAPTAKEVAERMLYRAADELAKPDQPAGCLLIQAGLSASPENAHVPKELALRRRAAELALRDRFRQAKVAHDLPADADPTVLASYVIAVIGGLSVQAAGGASRRELRKIVEQAMSCWHLQAGALAKASFDGTHTSIEPPAAKPSNGRGRRREFDTDRALRDALRVFWLKGYEGASLSDLTDATGITRPSLYAAFGNKDALFVQVLDLYEREELAYVRDALQAPTAREVIKRYLMGVLKAQTTVDGPRGCLGVMTSMQCSDEARSVREIVKQRHALGHAALIERFALAKASGELLPSVEPEGLARLLEAIGQGLVLQASEGATEPELRALVTTALSALPLTLHALHRDRE
ncbi:hypothetical protein PPGU16_81240 (plasmid) [Paraburkholderia largidicola]|uniref:HTH tetR-type domain-containing protein n=1 Tax=Paraburkholderia largidicola TaxID=3014751 RepID=A0A7I8C1W1_9BURK|nr:hypothetical protein PPGU16_81240 [Paraburkholderia sp. PGU16]